MESINELGKHRGVDRAERVTPALKRIIRDAALPRGLKALAPPHECGGFHHRGFAAQR
jgi:hypothetical protein